MDRFEKIDSIKEACKKYCHTITEIDSGSCFVIKGKASLYKIVRVVETGTSEFRSYEYDAYQPSARELFVFTREFIQQECEIVGRNITLADICQVRWIVDMERDIKNEDSYKMDIVTIVDSWNKVFDKLESQSDGCINEIFKIFYHLRAVC